MIKKSVWSVNVVGKGGIDAKTDFEIGENDEDLAAIQLGETDLTEEDFQNLKHVDYKIEETVREVAVPIIKPEIKIIVDEDIRRANIDGGLV